MADGSITVEVSTQAAQAELERLRAENADLKHDLQYARDGLTRGRTRMREDNERLRAALGAGCCSGRTRRKAKRAEQTAARRSARRVGNAARKWPGCGTGLTFEVSGWTPQSASPLDRGVVLHPSEARRKWSA